MSDRAAEQNGSVSGNGISGQGSGERRWMRPDIFSQEVVRLAVLVTAVAVAVLLLHFTPLRTFMKDINSIQHFVDRAHILPELLFLLLTAVLVAFGVSRLVLGGIAGMLFGFWSGLLIVQTGSLAGAYLMYRSVRWGGRNWFKNRADRYPVIQKIIQTRPSVLFVFMLRQMPFPGFVVNAGLGLGSVKSSVFLAGSFLGWLPQGIVVALMGDVLAEDHIREVGLQLLLAGLLVVAAAAGVGIRKVLRE